MNDLEKTETKEVRNKQKPLKDRSLTDKDRLVLAELAKTKDWTKAIARVYGYLKKDPAFSQKIWNAKHRILAKDATGEVLSSFGLDVGTLGLAIRDQMDAKQWKLVDGKWTEVPDNPARGSAISLLADILGVRQKQSHSEIYSHTQSLVIHVESPEQARITAEKVKREWGEEIATPNYKVEEGEEEE